MTDARRSPEHDAAVRAFVDDFQRRVSQWDWWTDALYVSCWSPSDGRGDRRADPRVYLVGPGPESLPVHVWREEQLNGKLWVSLLLPDAIDLLLDSDVVATRALPIDGKVDNVFAVHLSRAEGAVPEVGHRWTHRPDVEVPEGYALVDDLRWVRDAVTELQLGPPQLP